MQNAQRQAKKRNADRLRIALKRSWQNGAHREWQQSREVDADTVRARALHDRRGKVYAHISFGIPNLNQRTFIVLHSRLGRTDQFDILHGEYPVTTCRENLILKRISEYVNGK